MLRMRRACRIRLLGVQQRREVFPGLTERDFPLPSATSTALAHALGVTSSYVKSLCYRDIFVEVHILNGIQNFNAFFHRSLKCFPT